jgi:hypothetical protein
VPSGSSPTNSWLRQSPESPNSFSSISNLWKRLSSSLETPTKEIAAYDEAERKAKAKGRGLVEPFSPSESTTTTTGSNGNISPGKRTRRERDRAADDSSTTDPYNFLPRQLSTSGNAVPLLTPRRKLISDEAEKMRIGRSATVTAYTATPVSFTADRGVSLTSSVSSSSLLQPPARPYGSLPPALRQKRDFERKFVYTFARSVGRKDAQLFTKRAGFLSVIQQTLGGNTAAGGSALAAVASSLSTSPSAYATSSPIMNAAVAAVGQGMSPPWKRARGSMIVLPSSSAESSPAIIPSGGTHTFITVHPCVRRSI